MLKLLTVRNVLNHLFFVLLFLVIPTLAFVRPPGESFTALTRVFIQDTSANFVLMCFFYFNYYLLLPKLFFKKQYLLYIVCVFVFLSLAFMLPYWAGIAWAKNHYDAPPDLFDRGPIQNMHRHPFSLASFVFDEFRRHLSLFFSAVFFSFLLRTRTYLAQVKADKLEAELLSLKSQINPHFLFNTLNSIYVLSIKKDDRASEAIINLSGLMRYVIKDANAYTIPLAKEIDYLKNYIELQKARLGNTALINFTCDGDTSNKSIAPLILITYIENAFKYGINPDVAQCTIDIGIHISNTAIQLTTFNNKVHHGNFIESTGIGMSNTKERLQHIYPNKHWIQVQDNADTYSVTLSIAL